jgi:hypothetical protein
MNLRIDVYHHIDLDLSGLPDDLGPRLTALEQAVSKLSDSLADLKATVDQEVIDHQATIDGLKQQLADAQAAAGEAPTDADFAAIADIKAKIQALDPRDPAVLPADQPTA